MICNIIEEIIGNQAELDLFETSIEVFPQTSWKNEDDGFHNFYSSPAIILPQS